MRRTEHPPVTPGTEYYTDVEAAELLGMEVEDVRKWVDHQVLVGAVVRGNYKVLKHSADSRAKDLKAKGLEGR